MSDKLEVSDIPLILELSLTLSNEEIAEKWEVGSSTLCTYLARHGYRLGKHRKEARTKIILGLYDSGMTNRFDISSVLEIEHSMTIGPGRVRTLLLEALDERAKSTS